MVLSGNDSASGPTGRPIGRRTFIKAAAVAATAVAATGCDGSVEGFSRLSSPTASLRVGVDGSNPLYEMLVHPTAAGSVPVENSSYNMAGFDLSVVARIASELSYDCRILDVERTDLASYLKTGFIDVAVSSVFNGSDDDSIVFSDPYAPVELAVVARAESPFADITDLAGLSGARMAARSGTDFDRAIARIPGVVHLDPYKGRTYPPARVAAGDIDATLVDRNGFSGCRELFPELVFAPIPAELCPQAENRSVRLAVRAEDTDLLARINEVIDAIGDVDADEMWRDAKESVHDTVIEA